MNSSDRLVRRALRRRERAQSSAHRFLHELGDPCLFGGGQLLQREGGRPHRAFVEVRRVAEAERRVPRVEFLRAREVANDLPSPAWLELGPHNARTAGHEAILDRRRARGRVCAACGAGVRE
jgi:hypothetical protein